MLSDRKVLASRRTDLKSPPRVQSQGPLTTAVESLLLGLTCRLLHTTNCDLAPPGSTAVQGGLLLIKRLHDYGL